MKRFTKNQIFVLIGISWISQIITSILVHQWSRTPDKNIYQSALAVWVDTFNPLVNFAFLLIGFAIKREMIPILKNRLAGFIIIFSCLVLPFWVGLGLLWLCPPLLWAMFSKCILWSPRSKFLLEFIHFIGQRTYGIYFFPFYCYKLYARFRGIC